MTARPPKDRRAIHFCPDWDYLLISPDDPEWEACQCAHRDLPILRVWSIYQSQTDHPGFYIARLYENDVATNTTMISRSLQKIRDYMEQKQLYRISPSPADDPSILELWL